MENQLITKVLKSKITVCFLIFWGITFLLDGIKDIEYYAINWTVNTLRDIQSVTWIFSDVFSVLAGIFLIIVAIKILKS